MRRLVLAFLLLAASAVMALAEERIEHFVSDATVIRDGSLEVTETITVTAEGIDIRRGILRDFPTTYTDRHGVRVKVDFDVLGVRRDGRDEPYALESLSNGVRFRIGDKDVLIGDGQHTYEIRYRTTRQLGFFNDYDELYWNVTGNGWTFAIEKATAIIRLPVEARIVQHDAYTGSQGMQGKDFNVLGASGNEYRAETTRRLEAGEGFTVAVAWQKGIIAAPTSGDRWSWWLADNAGLFALFLSLVASGGYYYYAWSKVGRDPPAGTIFPLFAPPAGMGPAEARFITKQGFDNRGFAAALVGLAVKKRLKIADDDGDFAITALMTSGAAPAISGPEQALYKALPSGTLALKQTNHRLVSAAKTALQKALARDYEGSVFVRNIGWFWMGALISIAGLALSAFLLPGQDGVMGLFTVAWSGIWWSVILGVGWAALKGAISSRGILSKLGSIGSLLFLIPFVGGGFAAPAMMMFGAGSPGLYMLIGTAVLLGIMNLTFYYLLRAPTVPGRQLLDQVEGFRMYLATAEEDRLNVLHPPEKTPELFERYLPYALALDCENEWNTKFATVLAAAAAAGATAPAWYSGSHWDAGRTGGFTDSLGSSLSSSVSSASTAPGSSSGSGGGGSSGGGGGGGGGSGW